MEQGRKDPYKLFPETEEDSLLQTLDFFFYEGREERSAEGVFGLTINKWFERERVGLVVGFEAFYEKAYKHSYLTKSFSFFFC